MAKMTFVAPPPTPAAQSPRKRRQARVSEHGHLGPEARDSGAWFESTRMLRDGLDVEELPPGSSRSENVGRKVRKP